MECILLDKAPFSYIVKRKLISPEKGALTSIYLASSNEVRELAENIFLNVNLFHSIKNLYNEEDSKKFGRLVKKLTESKT